MTYTVLLGLGLGLGLGLEGSPQNIFCIFLPVQNLHAAHILIPLLNSFLDGSSRIFFEILVV